MTSERQISQQDGSRLNTGVASNHQGFSFIFSILIRASILVQVSGKKSAFKAPEGAHLLLYTLQPYYCDYEP